jgi:hypothetical protein
MSAWSIINTFAGLSYKNGEYTFAPKLKSDKYKLFFAVPNCYGHIICEPRKITIKTKEGVLNISKLNLALANSADKATITVDGNDYGIIPITENILSIEFEKELPAIEIIINNFSN